MKRRFRTSQQHKYTQIMLAATLFALPFGAQAAEPELAFHPTRAWDVRTVEGAEIGAAGPACTLANVFNNGFVIQITGTQASPNNMNIDFRQPVFETGSSHEVTLSVPARQSQRLTGQAAGKALLVVGLENSRDLFEAMRNSGVVDLGVEGNAFRFYLTGFSDATARFDDCVRGAGAKEVAPLPLQDPETALEPEVDAFFEETIIGDLYDMDAPPVPVTEIVPPLPETTMTAEAQRQEAQQKESISRQTETERVSLARPAPPQYKRLSEQLAEQLSQEPASARPPPELTLPRPAEAVTEDPAAEKETGEASLDNDPDSGLTDLAMPEEDIRPENPSKTENDEGRGETKENEPKQPETIAWNAPRVKPEPARIQARTPEPVVTRRGASAEVDLTGVYAPGEAPPQLGPEQFPERVEPSSSDSQASRMAKGRDDLADLNRKISELEKLVRKLRDENATLDEELKMALEAAQEERVAISSENWNLERATMRYNEAERQIRRLGQQLQRERAACEVEKRELESMLFDPAVTDQQQIARLADLEGKLRKTEEELELQRRRYEERIRILEERLGGQ